MRYDCNNNLRRSFQLQAWLPLSTSNKPPRRALKRSASLAHKPMGSAEAESADRQSNTITLSKSYSGTDPTCTYDPSYTYRKKPIHSLRTYVKLAAWKKQK